MDESQFTTEQQFEANMFDLVGTWEELGIDPDDFLKCATHRELILDPDNDWEPTEHYYYQCKRPEGPCTCYSTGKCLHHPYKNRE